MQAIEELYLLQQGGVEDVCCENHKAIYAAILLRMTMLNEHACIRSIADDELKAVSNHSFINKNIVERLFHKYRIILCSTYFGTWRKFAKNMTRRRRFAKYIYDKIAVSKANVFCAWKQEASKRVLQRGEHAHALALHDVGNNLRVDLENRKAINSKYIQDIKEIKQSQRELESQLKHLQKNHNDLLDDVGRAKHAYEDATSALSKERGEQDKEIERLILLIEREGMTISEIEHLIDEKELLLNTPAVAQEPSSNKT